MGASFGAVPLPGECTSRARLSWQAAYGLVVWWRVRSLPPDALMAAAAARDPSVELPFEVLLESRDVARPSPALAYALVIADMLSPAHVSQGRTVEAAANAGADVFMVPAADADHARRGGLPVEGVASLSGTLGALTTTRV